MIANESNFKYHATSFLVTFCDSLNSSNGFSISDINWYNNDKLVNTSLTLHVTYILICFNLYACGELERHGDCAVTLEANLL